MTFRAGFPAIGKAKDSGRDTQLAVDNIRQRLDQIDSEISSIAGLQIGLGTQTQSAIASVQTGLASAQQAIVFQDEGIQLGIAGSFTVVNISGRNIVAQDAGGGVVKITESAQDPIQFKDEGVSLGAAGTVTSLNIIGPNVKAARSTNAVTITEKASSRAYAARH